MSEKMLEMERAEEKRKKALAREVTEDFLKRREQRRKIESGWTLNLNFFSGNQYCDVSPLGDVVEEDRQFYWQARRAFNHIAPTVDARIAKLERMKPELRVRAFSDEEGDVKAAKLATGILQYVQDRISLQDALSKAILWAETCGSVFYKVLWNEKGGRQVAVDDMGKPMYEGEVQVSVVPPFEIFPDRLDVEELDGIKSIIHAQAVTAEYVKERFGVTVKGEEITTLVGYSEPSAGRLPTESVGINTATVEEGVTLIERYTKPCSAYPKGRLEIVAGGELLFEGDLPYKNGEREERDFPFVKQDCLRLPGAFFAGSVIDRLIPVQRAYNAVRNRKHEFLNRLSMGVLTVEDGSIDTDELTEEGLLPGKVLVYRQGGKAPEMLDCGSVPSEFKDEEEWLEKEFALISGVSDLTRNSTPARVTSATGLQLLISQDDTRLSATMVCIERAMKAIGRQVLRLYRQFAGNARLMTMTGEDKKAQVYYFNASKLEVSDIQFESQENSTPEEKKEVLLRLYEAGLLTDEDGKMSKENKNRILEAFGFGSYENARDISALHIAKAGEENLTMKSAAVLPDEFDEHTLHIQEHVRFLLSSGTKTAAAYEEIKGRVGAHIKAHKEMEKAETERDVSVKE